MYNEVTMLSPSRQVLEDQKMQELQRTAAEHVLSMLAPPSSSYLQSSDELSLTVADEFSQKPSMAAAATILEFFDLNISKRSPVSY